ncbi:MAG: sel1 repeat family protein [Proteobacteria bacterium]|nr:sel1 repeat family protein [Pseudomonadota bacterium]
MNKFYGIIAVVVLFLISFNIQAYENVQINLKKKLFEQYVFAYDNGFAICPTQFDPKVMDKLKFEFSDYLKQAKAGSSKAAYYVGLAYLNGFGIKIDNSEGMRWLKKAVEADYTPAQLAYAGFYRYRKKNYGNFMNDVPSNEQMLNWIKSAATNDNIIAQLALETIYLDTDQYQKAFALAEPMAKKGYAIPQYVLGTLYYYGLGVEIDYAKALYWYQLALKHDPPLRKNTDIMGNISQIYTKPGFSNTEKVLYWNNKMKEFERVINHCEN